MSRDFFDGTAGYLETVGSPSRLQIIGGNNPFFVAAWVRPDTVSFDMAVINKYEGHGPLLRIRGDGTIGMFVIMGNTSGAEAVSAAALTVSEWAHIGGGYDGGSELKVTRKGVITTGSMSFGAMSSSQHPNWRVGLRGTGSNNYDGLMADIAIWNAYLSDAECASLAGGVSPRLIRPGSLRGYWPLTSTSSPERDLSGGGPALDMGLNGGMVVATRNPPVMAHILGGRA